MQNSAVMIDLAQGINLALLVVQAAALVVLVWYSFETRRIKRASIAQAEATHQPCLLLPEELPEQKLAVTEATTQGAAPTCRLATPVLLRNAGSGPAISIRYWATGGEFPSSRLATYSVPYLREGHGMEAAIPLPFLRRGSVAFVAEYSSISGVIFRSEVMLENGRIQSFAHRKIAAA